MALANWDPPEHERTYYYHRLTGDTGYIVRREGNDCIKYDRPNQEIIRQFRPEEWQPKIEHRPMTRGQVAAVAFEADKALCRLLGEHLLSRREWLNLRDEERIAWVANGPAQKKGPRRDLFDSVMSALAPYAST